MFCTLREISKFISVVVVQSLSYIQLFVTSWTAAHQASLSFTISWSWLKLMSVGSMMPSNHLICCHPLSPPALNFPQHQVFSNESVLRISWPKYWSFSISPSNEYSGLISFRIDCFDRLAVQGTFKSLIQNHNSKASVHQCLAFFVIQFSHPYITLEKPCLWLCEPVLIIYMNAFVNVYGYGYVFICYFMRVDNGNTSK